MSSFPRQPLLLRPTFSARPWGGNLLKLKLGKKVPPGETIGESWELSDHPNGRSAIGSGPYAGKTFGELLKLHPREMVGCKPAPERYPLLVKILDAGQDLSIQVHPNDAQAATRGDRGKTECWYVMNCAPGAEIIYGLTPGVTAEQLRAGAADGSIAQMVAHHPIAPGQFLFVPPGTVHAILGGTLLCEIQQASDTTYRLWDWNRQPTRELHLEQSLEVIDFKSSGRKPFALPPLGEIATPMTLTDNEYFIVRALDIVPGKPHHFPEDLALSGTIISSVAGSGVISCAHGEISVLQGATAFIPAACEGEGIFSTEGGNPWRILLSESREIAAS